MNSYHLTQWVLFFFFYSFAGWIWESCYVSVRKHRWVNRGFMHGPMLPIYGSGALVVLISTIGVRENVVLIFLFGMTAATLLEYVTGAAMESLFHVRYWDYSNQKLNLHGYICVSSSLCWGCFSVLLVRVCHVPIETVVLKLPLIAADGIAFVLVAVAAADLTQSFNEAMDMKRILAQLEESKAQLQKLEEKLKAASAEVMEEYKKRYESMAEDYRRRADEWRQETVFRKEAFLERINQQREQRRGQLVWLGEKAEQLLKEELPSKINEMIGGERAKDLAEIKQNIIQELQKLNSRTDRNYLRIAKHLRRNPTAASKNFNDALEELRKFMDIK